MCGITGIHSFLHPQPLLPSWLQGMTDMLRHRGPDDEGYAFFSSRTVEILPGRDTPSQVINSSLPYTPRAQGSSHFSVPSTVLGHRRLSILDPSAGGHQPMCDPVQRYWLVYNGEIYNYKELKTELEKAGHTFYSTCDTEVILRAYIQWGESCVLKFNGMWAFAIFDKETRSFFCSRDRFGVKPFYYTHNQNYFAFASEQKALLTLPFLKKELNQEAVYDYLVLGQTEVEPEGFFKNLFELSPGHNLFIQGDQVSLKRYYTLSANLSNESFQELKARDHIYETASLLENAVKLRLRSDVEVGACLSGGVDSSALVCLADTFRRRNEKFHVFTSVFPGQSIDESQWAKKVVDVTDTTWHTVESRKEEVLEVYKDLVYTQDIPFFGSSTFSQYKVMELIRRQGIKVTLDGQGADELFSGYAQHFYVATLQDLLRGKFAHLAHIDRAEPHAKYLFGRFLGKKLLSIVPSGMGYSSLKKSKYDFEALDAGFWFRFKDRYEHYKQAYPHNLNALLQKEYTGTGLKYLMRTADRNSMHHSVESRVPFADDHVLAEYVFSVPGAYKLHMGQTKFLLRESMKGKMPEAIRTRWDKRGFATPEKNWFLQLKGELKEEISDNLEPFIDTAFLKARWDELFARAISGSTLGISRFLILSLWRKRFGV